eukprot:SAG31_NODE_18_length_35375_cov_22.525315_17_plen_109_part_00
MRLRHGGSSTYSNILLPPVGGMPRWDSGGSPPPSFLARVIPHLSKRMLLLFPLFPLMGNGGEWGEWNIIKEYRLLSLAKQPQAGSLDIGHAKHEKISLHMFTFNVSPC